MRHLWCGCGRHRIPRSADQEAASWRNICPTADGVTRSPPVLKNTTGVLISYENFLLYLILPRLTNFVLRRVLIHIDAF